MVAACVVFSKTVISRGVVCLRVYTSLHPKPLLIGPLALPWFGFVLSLFFILLHCLSCGQASLCFAYM